MLKTIEKHKFILIGLFLVVVTFSVYGQVKDYDFVDLDDPLYITENPAVQKGLTVESLKWAFTTTHGSEYWHPLTWLSHMLDVQLFGLNPGRHHLMNVLFHIANTLLLFLILNRMTRALWQSALVAALFALHPLHVESVAWVTERKDVLSTFFLMLTLYAYIRYVEKPDTKKYLFALSFFALGLMAKPMLVTIPFALLLLDYWPLGRFGTVLKIPGKKAAMTSDTDSRRQKRKTRKSEPAKDAVIHLTKGTVQPIPVWVAMRSGIRPLLREKIPFFVLSFLSSAITLINLLQSGTSASMKSLPFEVRAANAMVSYIRYLIKTIWPQDLTVLYPAIQGMAPSWQVFGAALLLIALTFISVRNLREVPYLAVGWFWYLGILFPVIGFFRAGAQEIMADRFTYVPLIGISMIIAWGVPDLLGKWRRRNTLLALSAGVVLVLLTAATWRQVEYWKNSILLFEHALAVTKDNYRAHNNLGTALEKQGKVKEARMHYEEALRINPGDANANVNMGNMLLIEGKVKEAIAYYTEVIRLEPTNPDSHYNLGNVLVSQGKTEEAVARFREALRLNPDYVEAHNNLGNVLVSQGKIEEAVAHFREAIRIHPGYVKAYANLGYASAAKGNLEEAAAYFKKALSLKPDSAETHYNLGGIMVSLNKPDEAITHFQEAVRLRPDYAQAHNNLGSALLLKGRTGEAIEHFREALRLQPDYKVAQDNLRDALSHRRKSRR